MSSKLTVDLSSFGDGLNVAVFGASGGLGGAFVAALAQAPAVAHVLAAARTPPPQNDPKVTPAAFDLEDEPSIIAAMDAAAAAGPLHLVIAATGVLHDGAALQPEKSWRAVSAEALRRVHQINTVGPALIAKHALGHLARDSKAAFAAVSARVGSITDNGLGGWHAYRASKAALNMLIKTFAIELARKNPSALCVALHPGTVDTGLSKPFQGNVRPEKLLTPAYSAAALLTVLNALGPAGSGGHWAWDGAAIPP